MHDLFFKWTDRIKDFDKKIILEPFAGTNNIVDMLKWLKFNNEWRCFDIDSKCRELTEKHDFRVETRNTLDDFPKNFDIAITNPPYLARNSATRSGI